MRLTILYYAEQKSTWIITARKGCGRFASPSGFCLWNNTGEEGRQGGKKKGRQPGRPKGRKVGRKVGRQVGRKVGWKEGRLKGR